MLGVVALIIIYIIKPNYQQKAISSTFIWKLSLKYKKRKLPTSTLRNLLLILCQVLILTICAFILTKPSTLIKTQLDESEVIIILDASSSMRAVNEEEESRFERAVEKSIEKINEVFENDGIVSVIF
ncbi:MAG: VWA domain-containing protein, partial [Clostridia bacterium]|nr:VWA domain-containing protein [Clostridia bacterium]